LDPTDEPGMLASLDCNERRFGGIEIAPREEFSACRSSSNLASRECRM
jgi:hypothetical protein